MTMMSVSQQIDQTLTRIERKLRILIIGLTVMLAGFSAVFALLWQIFLRLPR